MPPANGASQGNYFLTKSHKLALLKKNRLSKTALAAKVANFFSNGFWFWLDEASNNLLKNYHFEFPCSARTVASPKIIGVKVCSRQTDKFFETIYGGMWIFSFI